MNICNIAGRVVWAGTKKHGSNWGILNAKIELPKMEFMHMGEIKRVQSPFIWMTTYLNYTKQGSLDKESQNIVDNATANKYILIVDAHISSFSSKDDSGRVIMKRKLDTRPKNVFFSEKPFNDLNICIFSGSIGKISPKGWTEIETRYYVKKEARIRNVLLLLRDPNMIPPYSKALVQGQFCCKLPNGEEVPYVAISHAVTL